MSKMYSTFLLHICPKRGTNNTWIYSQDFEWKCWKSKRLSILFEIEQLLRFCIPITRGDEQNLNILNRDEESPWDFPTKFSSTTSSHFLMSGPVDFYAWCNVWWIHVIHHNFDPKFKGIRKHSRRFPKFVFATPLIPIQNEEVVFIPIMGLR